MQCSVFETPKKLAKHTAEKIYQQILEKPNSLLCLAGGETPRLTYQCLVEMLLENNINVSKLKFISLDEWVGIAKNNLGSCFYFLNETIYQPLAIAQKNIFFFDAMSDDLKFELVKINNVVECNQGIDLMLAGVGMNGHVGFNEPGISGDLSAHIINLDAITQNVGQKYFSEDTKLTQGITLGMGQFVQSKTAILLATGKKKAGIVQKLLQEPISNSVPASYIRQHHNGFVFLDQEAASLAGIH